MNRLVDSEFVRRNVVGNRRGIVLPALHVRAVLAHASHDHLAVFSNAEWNRVHSPSVDLAEAFVDLVFQTFDLVIAKVELAEPRDGFTGSTGDGVEVFLHTTGVGVVHQIWEVLFEQTHDRECLERRDEGRALLPDVLAVLDGAHDRRVRRWATDFEFRQLLDQRCLGIPGRRLGLMPIGGQRLRSHRIANDERRQLLTLRFLLLSIGVLDIDPSEALMINDRSAGRERNISAGARGRSDSDRHRLASGVGHLRSNGALPDEFVYSRLGLWYLLCDLGWRFELLTRRTDCFMCLLSVLRLGRVGARLARKVLLAVVGLHDLACGRYGRLAQRRRVGTHVRDQTLFVQRLGSAHGHRRTHTELASSLLLEGRCHERCRRATSVRLGLDRSNREVCRFQRIDKARGSGFVEHNCIGLVERSGLVKITP